MMTEYHLLISELTQFSLNQIEEKATNALIQEDMKTLAFLYFYLSNHNEHRSIYQHIHCPLIDKLIKPKFFLFDEFTSYLFDLEQNIQTKEIRLQGALHRAICYDNAILAEHLLTNYSFSVNYNETIKTIASFGSINCAQYFLKKNTDPIGLSLFKFFKEAIKSSYEGQNGDIIINYISSHPQLNEITSYLIEDPSPLLESFKYHVEKDMSLFLNNSVFKNVISKKYSPYFLLYILTEEVRCRNWKSSIPILIQHYGIEQIIEPQQIKGLALQRECRELELFLEKFYLDIKLKKNLTQSLKKIPKTKI